MSKTSKQKKIKYRCSGYGCFPDGKKCAGCSDCGYGKKVLSISGIKKKLDSKSITISKRKK